MSLADDFNNETSLSLSLEMRGASISIYTIDRPSFTYASLYAKILVASFLANEWGSIMALRADMAPGLRFYYRQC